MRIGHASACHSGGHRLPAGQFYVGLVGMILPCIFIIISLFALKYLFSLQTVKHELVGRSTKKHPVYVLCLLCLFI